MKVLVSSSFYLAIMLGLLSSLGPGLIERWQASTLSTVQASPAAPRLVVVPRAQQPLEAIVLAATTEAQPVQAQQRPTTPAPTPQTPHTLTYAGVESDLSSLGYTLNGLRTQGIEIMAHEGRIPKRCVAGPSGSSTTSGLAIKTQSIYPPCPDGGQPIFDAYRPEGYQCAVIYNRQSAKRMAILAHEIGHCLHFRHGQYRSFDIQFKQLRNVSHLTTGQLNEIIADDFMICRHSLDTNWGASSYYNRYSVARPNDALCAQINNLITTHLIK